MDDEYFVSLALSMSLTPRYSYHHITDHGHQTRPMVQLCQAQLLDYTVSFLGQVIAIVISRPRSLTININ